MSGPPPKGAGKTGTAPVTGGGVGKPSLNKFALFRLMTVERATRQTHATVKRTKMEIENRMRRRGGGEGLHDKELALETFTLKNEILADYKKTLQRSIERATESSSRAKNEYLDRKSRLESLREDQQKKALQMEEERRKHLEKRELFLKSNAILLMRRKQLIAEVSAIYPVAERSDPKTNRREFTIAGFVVPNADELSSVRSADEERVATGLGYTAHMILMISQFLDMPLRFKILHCGSRSRIHDHITKELSDRDRDFPLHSKGKEKFLFNYGVFLLNKNIAQLRHYCGMATQDLRNTLPNLHSLLEQRLGVQLGDRLPNRTGAGLHSLPSSSNQITNSEDIVKAFHVDESMKNGGNASSQVEQQATFQTNGDPGKNTANGQSNHDSYDERVEEEDEDDEKESWLKRNPEMASIVGEDAPLRNLVDSSDNSAANSGDEAETANLSAKSSEEKFDETETLSRGVESPSSLVDAEAETDATPTAENPPDSHLRETLVPTPLAEEGNDVGGDFTANGAVDPLTPVPGPAEVAADDQIAFSPKGGVPAEANVPKGLRLSNHKRNTAHRPAGLQPGLAGSKPFGGGFRQAAKTSSASSSRPIAEIFAKQKAQQEGGAERRVVDGARSDSRTAILTNANFNLVDRSKRVISDD